MATTRGGGGKGADPPIWPPLAAIGLLLLVFLASSLLFAERDAAQDVAYSDFLERLDERAFRVVEIDGAALRGILPADGGGEATVLKTWAPSVGDPALMERIEASGATIRTSPPRTDGGWLAWLPLLVLMGIWLFVMRRTMAGAGRLPGRADDFLGRLSGKASGTRPDVTFEDVAGQDQAKREVAELVDFLRDPAPFTAVGAHVPRGVLLMGPPGTGKTLLARALAGEAGVPFFSTSASAFIELFVGVGAARVRRMFDEARKAAPAVVFIDELDSIGRVRGAGLGGGHDEREQTLNQILAEMDGFTGREGVVVLAATNRPDILDPALLRPGRFDRHVTLTLPDRAARRAILDLHARRFTLGTDVDLDAIAAGTPGFSGADLENLVNEAAILAGRQRLAKVPMACLEEARDKILLGTIRTMAIRPDEHHRLAVHEAGHTIVAWHVPEADPVHKVTIIPRGRSLGGTHLLPQTERQTMAEGYLRAQLTILLAGRAAEQVYLGDVSSGADDDIARATALARSMIGRWGMSDEIGPVDLRDSDEHPFLGREMAQPRRFAEATAARLDAAVIALLKDAQAAARHIIETRRPAMDRLVATLETQETLDHAAVEACLAAEERRPVVPGKA